MAFLSLLVLGGFSAVYPSILSLCLVSWVFILHRRSRVSTKQVVSNTAFASERNQIMDAFGRDESLEAILNRICSLVEQHAPGSTCLIELVREGGVPRDMSPGGLPILSLLGKTVAVMRVTGGAASAALIDESKRLTAQAIEQRRLYDRALRQSPRGMLDGIVDRVLLDERLDAALSRARAHNHGVGLIHVGLESFDDINELLGAAAAEIVLHCTAFRLLACTRPSDHVARIGRDEFSVILTELHGRVDAEDVARRIVASLDAPISVEKDNIHVGAAAGICIFPEQASDSREMQRRAHLAMYSAKNGSESHYSFHEDVVEHEDLVGKAQATEDLLALNSALPSSAVELAPNCMETSSNPVNLG